MSEEKIVLLVVGIAIVSVAGYFWLQGHKNAAAQSSIGTLGQILSTANDAGTTTNSTTDVIGTISIQGNPIITQPFPGE